MANISKTIGHDLSSVRTAIEGFLSQGLNQVVAEIRGPMFNLKKTERFNDAAAVLRWAEQLTHTRSLTLDGHLHPDQQRSLSDFELYAREGHRSGMDFHAVYVILPKEFTYVSTSDPKRGTAIDYLALWFNPNGVKKIPRMANEHLQDTNATLRTNLIRLAHTNPELRSHLLPLLKEGGGETKEAAVSNPELDRLVKVFQAHLQKTMDDYYGKEFPTLGIPQIKMEWGRRYIRIVKESAGSRSAFGFIDTETGALLKAASWKAPAPIPRGNIYDEKTWKGSHSPWGMAYLR